MADIDKISVDTSDEGLRELLKQADALVEAHNTDVASSTSHEKPSLPKKEAKPQTKGRSFDIIQPANGATRSRATLKTGFRGMPTLRLRQTENSRSERPIFMASPQIEKEQLPEQLVSVEPADTEMAEETLDTSVVSPPATPLLEERTISSRGELYPSNLVKDAKPKGYVPHPKQHNPIVFDTNEYHTALHDWPKKEAAHHSGRLWLTTAILGAGLVCGVIYILFVN